jgi:hypothetical protein
MLVHTPAVYATNCTTSGGNAGGPTYYAGYQDTDTSSAYGVGAYSTPESWTLNTSPSNGHMDMWVNLLYNSNSWSQVGYQLGYASGIGTLTSRYVYFEFVNSGYDQTGTGYIGDAIPNNDGGLLEAWTYSENPSGQFTAEGEAYSSYWNLYMVSSANMGIFLKTGLAQTSIEAYYKANATCDVYTSYSSTETHVYTTSVSTSQPINVGTSWSNCAANPNPSNSPYHAVINVDCWGVIEFYGS